MRQAVTAYAGLVRSSLHSFHTNCSAVDGASSLDSNFDSLRQSFADEIAKEVSILTGVSVTTSFEGSLKVFLHASKHAHMGKRGKAHG